MNKKWNEKWTWITGSESTKWIQKNGGVRACLVGVRKDEGNNER
jgi:hypothetical protein